jgi:hypothetical protein
MPPQWRLFRLVKENTTAGNGIKVNLVQINSTVNSGKEIEALKVLFVEIFYLNKCKNLTLYSFQVNRHKI